MFPDDVRAVNVGLNSFDPMTFFENADPEEPAKLFAKLWPAASSQIGRDTAILQKLVLRIDQLEERNARYETLLRKWEQREQQPANTRAKEAPDRTGFYADFTATARKDPNNLAARIYEITGA